VSKFGFDRVKQNMDRLRNQAPRVLANQAQNFFVESFQKEAWRNGGVYKWKVRKGNKDPERALLVKTARMKRAVASSIRNASMDSIRLVVDVPYAEYHNEGTDNIPKRQFMGDSKDLRVQQVKKLHQMIDKIWQV
jgi:phage gpG-like protein